MHGCVGDGHVRAPSLVTRSVRKGPAPFGPSSYVLRRTGLIDDDGGAGRRPVPEPDHVAVGNVDAAVRTGVFAGRVVVGAVGAGSIARAPGGVVDPVAAVKPHDKFHFAVRGPERRTLGPRRVHRPG